MTSVRARRRGFTLVELLVVIAIIGVLVALLLPAVQSARESARRSQCLNHLKQIGVGFLNHESGQKFLPCAGWSPWVVGDPDMGMGLKQPGGWMYQILPFVEQQALYDLPGDGQADVITAGQKKAAVELQLRGVTILNCPSRRPSQAIPFTAAQPGWTPRNSDTLQMVVCSDYAANAGSNSQGTKFMKEGCESENEADDVWFEDLSTFAWLFPPYNKAYNNGPGRIIAPPFDSQNGINFLGAKMELRHITDGTTNTYMVGEKSLSPDFYMGDEIHPGLAKPELLNGGDNHSMFQGFDWDTHRWAMDVPVQDTPGVDFFELFGSPHAGGWHALLCDGSVRVMSYDIDLLTHKRLANRADGQPVGSF